MPFKHLLLFTSFLFFSVAVNAQWSFSIKGSVHQTWVGDNFDYFKTNNPAKATGIGTSLQFYYNTKKHLSFGVEPGFAQRGATNPLYNDNIGFCGTGIDHSQFPYNYASIYTDYTGRTKSRFHNM